MAQLLFAPLEGITSRTFREVHAAFYTGVDRYYTPFLAPSQVHRLTPGQHSEFDPGRLGPQRVVPQLLTKCAEDFLWAARILAELGYDEINLNLGCPSGTVVSKGKGAGMLRDLSALQTFLDAVFAASPLPLSVKTRIGLDRPEEFGPILAVLAQYPWARMIVHPRTRKQFYQGQLHEAAFGAARQAYQGRLCFNGDLTSPGQIRSVLQTWPGVDVMIGRGLLADPALAERLSGGRGDRQRLRDFHNTLCREYLTSMHPNQAVLPKMKELWTYLIRSFCDDGAMLRALCKAKRWEPFYELTQAVFDTLPLADEA